MADGRKPRTYLVRKETRVGDFIMISIVIPIYNAEKYIRECLDRIIKQGPYDIEIVLVNDGSLDGSLEICNQYAQQDDRVIVLDQNNMGPAAARKTGALSSHGEYIMFLDSDDYLDDTAIKTLNEYINEFGNVDIIHFDFHVMDVDGNYLRTIVCPFSPGLYKKNEIEKTIYPKMLYYNSFYKFGIQPSLWNKMIKREIVLKNISSIPSEVFFGEDGLLTYQCFFSADSVLIINEALYHYRENEDSITRRISRDKDVLKQNNVLITEYEKIDKFKDELLKKQLANYVIYITWIAINEEYLKRLLYDDMGRFVLIKRKITINLRKYYREHKWEDVSFKTRMRMYLVSHLNLHLLRYYFQLRYRNEK